MHNQFAKLYAQILTSTVWQESDPTRLVWITLLALKDEKGYVGASVPGLAHVARVSMEDCEKAIATFLEPDQHSRTKDFDGRRIEVADGGWVVLNAGKYRDKQTPKQAATAARVRKYRAKQVALQAVTKRDVRPYTYTDTDTDTEKTTTTTKAGYSEDFEEVWKAYPRRTGGNSKDDAYKAYRARIREGATPPEILGGVQRYAVFVRQAGNEGTEYVKMASTFFGKGQHFREPWTLPAAQPSNKAPAVPPWERENADRAMNQRHDVIAAIKQAQEEKGDDWWERMQDEAKAAGRWAAPYAYEKLKAEAVNA